MRAKEFINEAVTPTELTHLKHYLVDTFSNLGLDFRFGQHFYARVNDARNGKPITIGELTRLFTRTLKKYGKQISDMPPNIEVVLRDLATKINVPIAVTPEDDEDAQTVVAKTVMRKKDFGTSNPVLAIEQKGNKNVIEASSTTPSRTARGISKQIESSSADSASKEIITELGNASYPYTQLRDRIYQATTQEGKRIQVVFQLDSKPRVGFGVNLEFTVDDQFETSGRGDAFKIMATVMAVIKNELPKYIESDDVRFIEFLAKTSEPSRVAVYNRAIPIISRVAQSVGEWKFSKRKNDTWVIFHWRKI